MNNTEHNQIYCIDTSSLIDLWRRYYPKDIFKTLWAKFEAMILNGQIIAPREVNEELKAVDDDLLDWAKDFKSMFIELDEIQANLVTQIVSAFPFIATTGGTKPHADPFLVALAKSKNCPIITSESKRKGKSIPTVCKYYGIEVHTLVGFFRQEKWKI